MRIRKSTRVETSVASGTGLVTGNVRPVLEEIRSSLAVGLEEVMNCGADPTNHGRIQTTMYNLVDAAFCGQLDKVRTCCTDICWLLIQEPRDSLSEHEVPMLEFIERAAGEFSDSVLEYVEGTQCVDVVIRKLHAAETLVKLGQTILGVQYSEALTCSQRVAAEASSLFVEAMDSKNLISETDAVLLGYVDLAIFRPEYGFGKVGARTVSSLTKAGCGFEHVALHYHIGDIPDWLFLTIEADGRQAQLVAAAVARIDETYRIFKKGDGRLTINRDALVKKLLCEHDFCRR